MKEDDLTTLAQGFYKNHQEAFDFIFENRPDRLAEVTALSEKMLVGEGFILSSSNKGYVRFLTKKLDEIIPRTGTGWEKKKRCYLKLFLVLLILCLRQQ